MKPKTGSLTNVGEKDAAVLSLAMSLQLLNDFVRTLSPSDYSVKSATRSSSDKIIRSNTIHCSKTKTPVHSTGRKIR